MSTFTSEQVDGWLSDFNIILKYMPFLQEHGFTEFGKGQLTGKMELLKEGFSSSKTSSSERKFDSRISIVKADPGSLPEYKKEVPNKTTNLPIESSSNLEDSGNEIDPSDSKKYPFQHMVNERIDMRNVSGQRENKYLSNDNGWSIKNDDASSWITRIRKLAEI